MAERVIRLPEARGAVAITRASAEMHTVGSRVSYEANSWITGILAREHKLARVEKSAEWNREVAAMFEAWCNARGLTVNHGVLGVIRKAARVAARLGEKHAEPLLNAVPSAYRQFWNEYKDRLISGYRSIRL